MLQPSAPQDAGSGSTGSSAILDPVPPKPWRTPLPGNAIADPDAALPVLIRFLELNWTRVKELEQLHEKKDQVIASLQKEREELRKRSEEPWGKRHRLLQVECHGQHFEWLDLDENEGLLSDPDFVLNLQDNIEHYFDIPHEHQVLCDQAGPLQSDADIIRACMGVEPQLQVHDARELPKDDSLHLQQTDRMAPRSRIVQVHFNGKRFDWFDVESNLAEIFNCDDPEGAIRDNLAHYFGVPAELQLVSTSEHGVPLQGAAAFYASLQAPRPVLWLYNAEQFQATGRSPVQSPWRRHAEVVTVGTELKSPNGIRPALRSHATNRQTPGGDPDQKVTYHSPTNADHTGSGWLSPQHWSAAHGGLPRQISVVLQKLFASVSFGFAVVPDSSTRCLVISWIDPTGLLAQWNTCCPSTPVRAGDFIVAVNGARGSSEAMRWQLQNTLAVHMSICKQEDLHTV